MSIGFVNLQTQMKANHSLPEASEHSVSLLIASLILVVVSSSEEEGARVNTLPHEAQPRCHCDIAKGAGPKLAP